MLSGKVVGIIGAGNMGEVLIRGLIQSGKVKKTDIIASDVSPDRLKPYIENLRRQGHLVQRGAGGKSFHYYYCRKAAKHR